MILSDVHVTRYEVPVKWRADPTGTRHHNLVIVIIPTDFGWIADCGMFTLDGDRWSYGERTFFPSAQEALDAALSTPQVEGIDNG